MRIVGLVGALLALAVVAALWWQVRRSRGYEKPAGRGRGLSRRDANLRVEMLLAETDRLRKAAADQARLDDGYKQRATNLAEQLTKAKANHETAVRNMQVIIGNLDNQLVEARRQLDTANGDLAKTKDALAARCKRTAELNVEVDNLKAKAAAGMPALELLRRIGADIALFENDRTPSGAQPEQQGDPT